MTPKTRHALLLSTAKRRKIEVNLNSEHYNDLLELGCTFCGDTLVDKGGVCLDRLDNKKGYLDNNVAPCCKRCNVAKNDMKDQNEFFDWIDRVYKHKQESIERIKGYKLSEKEAKKLQNKAMNTKRMRNAKVLVNEV